MPDFQVIYDADQEIGAIVDLEEGVSIGPAMIGPMAGQALAAFMVDIGSAADVLTHSQMVDAFGKFMDGLANQSASETQTSVPNTVVPPADSGLSNETMAMAEAHDNAGAPPLAGPSDTDPGAATDTQTAQVTMPPGTQAPDTSMFQPAGTPEQPTTRTMACPGCSGQGDPSCPVCHGTGQMEIPA